MMATGGDAGGGGGAVSPVNYTQPLDTAAAPPDQATMTQATSTFDQARAAFRSGDYPTALQAVQQALGQSPNDTTMNEFLGLVLFAQGQYDKAAAPLYAVLSVGPGWDWTTLIGNYGDASVYTEQQRALETFVKANPQSAAGLFVLAYHYICQGHNDIAAGLLSDVVKLMPSDTLSKQLIARLVPPAASGAGEPAATVATAATEPAPFDAGKLTGTWTASAPQDAKVTLAIQGDGAFSWTVTLPGKAPNAIAGTATIDGAVLTLADQKTQNGNLAGQVTWQDDTHFNFKAVGAPAGDAGLNFAR
jgi:tetratricopeptide (TPR) repeat protein